jgi:glycine dehydrogenase
MLDVLKLESLDSLTRKSIPSTILVKNDINVGDGLSEKDLIDRLGEIAKKNKIFTNYIGLGYYDCIVPPVIQRNVLENPQWYTQYTPYQPEISQGRLESLINFQTMVKELTAMDISNASLLDEGTAAAEAMFMCFSASKRLRKTFFIDKDIHPQTISCVQSRADGFGISVIVGDLAHFDFEANKDHLSGILFQYPSSDGRIVDYEPFVKKAHEINAQAVCATDLLALTVLKPPGEFGCDIALGNSQRFGVPLVINEINN